ncbi:chloride channel protein 2-like isoform X6 [Lytechinus variegatus]|uniref:chloride channel protein 2-like isoform X6 n=1 Tax=Lytechinus variegatus TaxID=7654 RepID=UPI001BB1D55C|nr:chloride channel protein 2-like isoform X6 [Lytechinus variegatus]
MAASRLARQSICAEMAKDQQDLLKFKMALQPDKRQMEYEQTLMHGQYSRDLGQFAKAKAAKLREEKERQRKVEDEFLRYTTESRCLRCKASLIQFRNWVFSKIGEDWIFLALLGVIMALLSFALDYTIQKFQTAQVHLFYMIEGNAFLQYLAWVGFPVILIVFSAGFVHLVSPHAIGSGIPEMKTILRGVVLEEYLSFRAFLSKVVGLATAVGSGMPLGKEGPFVHIASIVSTMLSKLIVSFKGIYENESRNCEMLAAACAVGVSCNFAAPIGGVLFSIEVTSVYFAVRNYWRGFFGAVCGAFVFRLLAVWNKDEETITALFKTNFRLDFPFDVQELVAFAFIGVVSGFGGALFVYLHRKIVDFVRSQKTVNHFLQKNRLIYPTLVAFVISSITFPLGLGQFMAGELTQKQQINELFSNTTLGNDPEDIEEENIYKPWHRPNVFVTLVVFIIMEFWMSAIAVTLPVPSGVFIPVFTIGAAFGRLVGEAMAVWFPEGIPNGDTLNKVVPGGYAVVGAAALSGSVTHTISTSVIVFELTGQITHILPVMIAVLIANAIAQLLQPSIYDSIIRIKKLPYLPDISHAGSKTYNIFVEDIMVRNLKFISWLSTYKELQDLLNNSSLTSFPLVDAPESMVLIGSVQRTELAFMLEKKIGRARRILVATSRRRREQGLDGNAEASGEENAPVVEFHKKPSSNERAVSINLSPVTEDKPETSKGFEGASSNSSPSATLDFKRASVFGKQIRLSIGTFEDMTEEEKDEWEDQELRDELDFKDCQIDPAPFHLVERTSLHKVHSLFSLLGLNHAYVTTLGRLMGVVALKEIRRAIEDNQYRQHEDIPIQRNNSPVDSVQTTVTSALSIQ